MGFSKSYIDFLLLTPQNEDGRWVIEWSVIDAKATDHVKIGAMVQVAFYALLLETIIRTDPRLASARPHLRRAPHGGDMTAGCVRPLLGGECTTDRPRPSRERLATTPIGVRRTAPPDAIAPCRARPPSAAAC